MPAKDTETMTRYDELRAALQRVFMFSDLTDADMDEMDKILSVLRKKAPLDQPHTTEEMWERFAAEHAEELASLGIRKNEDTEEVIEKGPEKNGTVVQVIPESEEKCLKKKRGFLRVVMTAAAMIVIIVAVTLTASAMGFNLWSWVPIWTDSTFRFVPEGSESATSLDIPEALKQLGIKEPLFPTWIPEGFVLDEQQIQMDEPVLFHSSYFRGDKALMITIRSISQTSQSAIIEKDSDDFEIYTTHNTDHYIFKNFDQTVSSWQSINYYVKVSGDISVDEMKRIIDSVYINEGMK